MIQHLNDVKVIARTAKQIGAELPADIINALEHLDAIALDQTTAPRPGHIAKDLAQHLGNPAAMNKARKAAALELATAEANAKVGTYLAETCGSVLRQQMRERSEEIAAAFGVALAADLAALQAEAAKLPVFFRAEHADTLDPATFTAWTRARDAHDRITAAQPALAILYSGAVAEHEGQFPAAAAVALRYANPPRFTTPTEAYAFRDALAGRANKGQGLAAQGSARVDGLFSPTVLAHAGARFEWATPSEVAERARVVVVAMTDTRVAV